MSRRPLQAALWLLTLGGVGLATGLLLGRAALARAQGPYEALDRFARVLHIVVTEYVDEVPVETLVDAAIEGMVDTLDPHSRWLRAEVLDAASSAGPSERVDLGLELRSTPTGAVVTTVLRDGPGAREGLQAGDVITEVDGRRTAGIHEDVLQVWLAGDRGTPVAIEVVRAGLEAPVRLKPVRDVVDHPAVTFSRLPDGVGYARIVQFQAGASAQLELLLRQAHTRGPPLPGLVLDLRDNPGGLLDEAVGVTDLFLEDGPIVTAQVRGATDEIVTAHPGGFPDLPLVVLVNGGSASASEVVAAALSDRGRATIVGSRTYGKGSIQQVYRQPEPGAWALKLTVGRYLTPSGQPVAAGEGRLPDVEVTDAPTLSPRQTLDARIDGLALPVSERQALHDLVDGLAREPGPPRVAWELPPETRTDPPLTKARALLRRN